MYLEYWKILYMLIFTSSLSFKRNTTGKSIQNLFVDFVFIIKNIEIENRESKCYYFYIIGNINTLLRIIYIHIKDNVNF